MPDIKHAAPQLEASGPHVYAKRDISDELGECWLVADCSMHRHGADYARLFAKSPALLQSAKDLLRIATRNDIPMAEQVELADRAIELIAYIEGR